MVRRAFTLIELLVVISIIIVLAGMVVSAYGILRERVRRSTTEATIATLTAALAMAGERGGSQAPVEHPLAGSAAPRPLFVRGTANLGQTGEALRAMDPNWVPAAKRDRLLLPDDRFAGGGATAAWQLPLLFGARRDRIGLLGTADQRITRWRSVPKPSSRTDLDSDGFTDVDTAGLFVDAATLQAAPNEDREAATAKAIEVALGGPGMSELAKQKALVRTAAAAGTSLCNGMAVSARIVPAWEPGAVFDPATSAWHIYRLIGTVVVDGWGREILYSRTAAGAPRLESAGRDGVFAWHPGKDGVYQTAAGATGPSGDDSDGSRDNIASAGE